MLIKHAHLIGTDVSDFKANLDKITILSRFDIKAVWSKEEKYTSVALHFQSENICLCEWLNLESEAEGVFPSSAYHRNTNYSIS